MSLERSGLTFVELLMAATIFSVVLVGLATHLRGGITVWRRTTTTMEELQRQRVVLERLAQDLANAVVLDPRPDSPLRATLTQEAMTFGTVQPRAGVSQAIVVTYARSNDEGAAAGTLTRAVRTAREAQVDAPARIETLLSDVRAFSVRYAYLAPGGGGVPPTLTWRPTWDDPKGLPSLVEITLERGGGTASPSAIRQVFAMPTGVLTPMEGTP